MISSIGKKITIRYGLILFLFAILIAPRESMGQDNGEVKSAIEIAKKLSLAFESVANKITPSIVSISSIQKIEPTKTPPQFPRDPFFDFFGEDFFEKFFQIPPPKGYRQQGLGTGVIVSEDGYLLTNNHVIEGADEVKVQLQNKKTYTAKIVGTDPRSDLAVIRIKAKGLKPAVLGDSDKLQIGEWVIAAGNPFGLDNTVTTGIVSAKGRSISGGSQYEDFIQTDAAINPGNSGGPLVNLNGEVVGINTAIFSRSGGYMGIGFAIPINMAKMVMESIIKHGKVIRGWLGVVIQNLSEELAKSFNYDSTKGALVSDVSKDSPAGKAGIRPGDIIVKYNGKEVKNVNHLRNMVAETAPGTKVAVKIFRDGSYKKLDVTIGELEPEKIASLGGPGMSPKRGKAVDEVLGIEVVTLTPEIAQRLRARTKSGVVVSRVQPYGLGFQSGLRTNDIITSVNGKRVQDVEAFRRLVTEASLKRGIRLVVETQGMKRFVYIRKR